MLAQWTSEGTVAVITCVALVLIPQLCVLVKQVKGQTTLEAQNKVLENLTNRQHGIETKITDMEIRYSKAISDISVSNSKSIADILTEFRLVKHDLAQKVTQLSMENQVLKSEKENP